MSLDVKTALLLDTYETLLTEKQVKIMRMRLDEDLSLGEIGEACGISRQAVHDAVEKSLQQLDFYENALHIVEKERLQKQVIKKLQADILSGADKNRLLDGLSGLERISEDADGI